MDNDNRLVTAEEIIRSGEGPEENNQIMQG